MTDAAFSSTDVLDKRVNFDIENLTRENSVQKFYDIERCLIFIRKGNYDRIALQFPDELLGDSFTVVQLLEEHTDKNIFILGDTSYGSCCVDEVAAQRLKADCIIHFGRSCLSQTLRLPVLHIFGTAKIDVQDCFEHFQRLFDDKRQNVIVFYDTIYNHVINELTSLLFSYKNVVISILKLPETTSNPSDKLCICNRIIDINRECLNDYKLFYVGCEGTSLSNLMMNLPQNQFYVYDPVRRSGCLNDRNMNKALMKRYYMVECIKDACIVGIVVGTLGVVSYLDIIKRIKQLLKNAGKKYYTFLVGKLNPAKLGNFMEVDVFVLVTCSESTLIDSKEYYKPIVTPFEVEVALNSNREWSSEYKTDFKELLPDSSNSVPIAKLQEEVDISLVTNKLRIIGHKESVQSTDVQIGHSKDMTVYSAGDFLISRSWQGLEQKLGETQVEKFQEGQKGIAMGYKNEQQND